MKPKITVTQPLTNIQKGWLSGPSLLDLLLKIFPLSLLRRRRKPAKGYYEFTRADYERFYKANRNPRVTAKEFVAGAQKAVAATARTYSFEQQSKGGKARAAKLTPEERSAQARHAANMRWTVHRAVKREQEMVYGKGGGPSIYFPEEIHWICSHCAVSNTSKATDADPDCRNCGKPYIEEK